MNSSALSARLRHHATCSFDSSITAADEHEGGTVIAVFPTIDGSLRYAIDVEGYGALQFFTEEKLVVHPC